MSKLAANVSGVVLAGGLSTRIGRDKGELEIGGCKLWLRSVDRMRSLFSDVVYVTNDLGFTAPYTDLVVAHDEVPHLGPLGGILAGLKAAREDRVFIVAYDMPFVSPELVRLLVDSCPDADITVPVIGGKYEPLHALYRRTCVPHVAAQLEAGNRKIVDFYRLVKVEEVEESELRSADPELLSFLNINTWEDVHLANSILPGAKDKG